MPSHLTQGKSRCPYKKFTRPYNCNLHPPHLWPHLLQLCVAPVTLIRPQQISSYRFVPQDPSACCALCLECLSPRCHFLQVWLNTSCSSITTLGRLHILIEAFPWPLSVNHKLTFHVSLFCFAFLLNIQHYFNNFYLLSDLFLSCLFPAMSPKSRPVSSTWNAFNKYVLKI